MASNHVLPEALGRTFGRWLQPKISLKSPLREARQSLLSRLQIFVEEDLHVVRTLKVISSRAIGGLNAFKDLQVSARDIFGGRSGTLENAIARLENHVIEDLGRTALSRGADAVVSCRIDHRFIEKGNGLLICVTGVGTPVELAANDFEFEEE